MSQYMVKATSQRGMGALTVPTAITRATPSDAKFVPEVTAEGILFSFVGLVPREANHSQKILPENELPDWMRA